MNTNAQCPHCGGAIAFRLGSSLATVCEHCSTVVARTDRALEDLGKSAELLRTRSPLVLWLQGQHQGVGFHITGRVQLQHSAGGVWDEWYLAFHDGRWGWLAEAQGRFYLTFRQPAGAPDLARGRPRVGQVITVGEPPQAMVVAEVGEATIIAGRGEIPYRFEPGERHAYADLSAEGGRFGTLELGVSPPALFLGHEVTLDALGIDRDALPQRHELGPMLGVDAVRCEQCGGALELHVPDMSERVACQYCGAMHDCERGVLRLLKGAAQSRVEPALPLGAQGRFEGEVFTLIGFMRRSVTEDGQVYPWDEYLLYHPRLGFRWLVESDGHFSYVRSVPVGEVQGPPHNRPLVAGDVAVYRGKKHKAFQQGKARVDYVAGEFYWKVEVGEEVYTWDFVGPPQMLSRELSPGEINWSLGTYMTRAEVARCFPEAALPARVPRGVAPSQPFRHAGVYPVWAALLVGAMMLLMWGQARSEEEVVHEQIFQVERRLEGEPVVFSAPFHLNAGRNARVEVGCRELVNNWISVLVDLVHVDSGEVYTLALPFEYYQGVSDGEHWSEGSNNTRGYLSAVPEGSYIMRAEVEHGPARGQLTIEIRVVQGVFHWRDFGLALLLASLIPLAIMINHFFFHSRRWSMSEFSGGDG